MDALGALAETVQKLNAAYERAEQRLARQLREESHCWPAAATPLDMVDPTGRYILLDALVALANAQLVLAKV